MKKNLGQDAIYDARELGVPRMLVLGLQPSTSIRGTPSSRAS